MNLFNIFPHNAYLNSEICIFSGLNKEINIINTFTGDVIKLSKDMKWHGKLKHGKHIFSCKYNDFEQIEEVVVENAYKLGGSTLKNIFIFDENPWSLVVMKDRTYFYNRYNGSEYLEHRFSPDKIEVISTNHLLMTSKNEMSIFSLELMKPIISFKEFVYIDDKYVVIDETEDVENDSQIILAVYAYQSNVINDESKQIIFCNDFIVDSENKIIFTYIDGRICSFLIEQSLKTELKSVSNTFKCFFNNHFVALEIMGYSKKLKVINLINTKEVIVISGYRSPLVSVNKKKIVDVTKYEEYYENLMTKFEDGYDAIEIRKTYLEISLFVIGDFVYYILKTNETFTSDTGKQSKKQILLLGCSATSYKREIQSNNNVYVDNNNLIIDDNHEIISLKNGKEINIFRNRKLIKTPNSYILYENVGEKDCFYSLNNSLLQIGNYDISYLNKYGIIISKNENKQSFFFIVEKKNYYYSTIIDRICEKNNKLIVYSKLSAFPSIHIGGEVFECNTTSIGWVSEKGQYFISNRNNKFLLSSWSDRKSGFIETEILSSIFDTECYSDAYFANGGSSVMYKENGKDEYTFWDILKQEKIEFATGKFIQNTNGYRPLIELDKFRKPVIIDPITMQISSSTYLSQYKFVSPGGRFVVETKTEIEYFHKVRCSNISEIEYQTLQNYYNFSFGLSDKDRLKRIENRISFIKEYKLDIKIDSFDVNSNSDFVSSVIITKIEYLNILDQSSNFMHKVKLGEPLWFLNYVSFSYDNKYMAVAGRYPNNSRKGGLFLLYEIEENEIVYKSENTFAVWISVFNVLNQVCFYTSNPNTYLEFVHNIKTSKNIKNEYLIPVFTNRNFLCFSPSGKYVALSSQGYIAKNSKAAKFHEWGHQPSSDIYIHSTDTLNEECHFYDHGDKIKGLQKKTNNVAFAAISNDDTRLLTISDDGVIIVRNLEFPDRIN